jgi:hypothetical protein
MNDVDIRRMRATIMMDVAWCWSFAGTEFEFHEIYPMACSPLPHTLSE